MPLKSKEGHILTISSLAGPFPFSPFSPLFLTMTRGNQREVDRARAAKRTDKRKPKESQADLTKRKERFVPIFFSSHRSC